MTFSETKRTAHCANKERKDNEESYQTNKSYPLGWPDHFRGRNPRVANRHGCARPGNAGTKALRPGCNCPHAPRDRTRQSCSLRPRLGYGGVLDIPERIFFVAVRPGLLSIEAG